MNSIIKLLKFDIETVNDESFDLYKNSNELAKKIGWEIILEETYTILSTKEHKNLWYGATCILFYAVSDGIEYPNKSSDEIIARLYWCLAEFDSLGNPEYGFNLVWSVVHQLKRVSYNSDWQPLRDEKIKEFIKNMN